MVVDEAPEALALWIGDESFGREAPEDRRPIELRDVVLEQVVFQPHAEVRIGLVARAPAVRYAAWLVAFAVWMAWFVLAGIEWLHNADF